MSTNLRTFRRASPRLPARERGVVLMIALIVLVGLTLAGLSMVRSADTGSVIAGNLAFRQASVQATDAAVEQAYVDLTNTYVKTAETSVANKYVSSGDLATDAATGLPKSAPAASTSWPLVTGVTLPSGFTARYFVERLCVGNGAPITDVPGKCITERAGEAQGGSQKVGSPVFAGAVKVNYRVTVRVDGPRNSLSLAQATFAY